MKLFFTPVLFLLYGFLPAQEKLNQFDESGKRHGKWLIYLDWNWKKVDDSARAEYCRYTVYDHGNNLYPMGPCGKNKWELQVNHNATVVNGVTLLDGEYKWLDEKGMLRSEHFLKNGEYISCKEYRSDGSLEQHFEYLSYFEEMNNAWTLKTFSKKGVLKETIVYGKDKNGKWPRTRG